jgi:hypothetical protein
MASKATSRAAPARIRRRLKLQILVSESKASVARRRWFAARSVDGAGATGIGASTDIRASTMESAGSDFLTAIENVLLLIVNGAPGRKNRIMVAIRRNKRDGFLIQSNP